jgi:predicted metalloprotease with PDZ domain
MTADSATPNIGASMADDTTAVWVNWSAEGGSMYAAGVSSGDRIFAVDGVPVATVDSLRAVVGRRKAGEIVQVDIMQRNVRRTIPMKLVSVPEYTISTFEKAGRPVTPEMKRFREDWLGSKATK